MSVIQRVIILNKPFRIRGYTIIQWVILVGALAIGFLVGSKVPGDWKLGNIPLGFLIGLSIVCGAIVFVSASQMKPAAWWRNTILYGLKMSPRMFLPHPEEGNIYPDPSIVEPTRVRDDAYISIENNDSYR